ncbi:DUF924 family protein [Paracoccus sp. p4-l81]|uniref:DUF924 family protein n=1 Tax=unclassified Paracoccus (in: a-proteobacteria) TaxID=2688777 RepID=UPI0035B7E483
MADHRAAADAINDLWLNRVGPKGWYARDDAVDAAVRDLAQGLWTRVQAQGLPDDWPRDPKGWLAALILTDQFPRNMFRDDPRAYASDALSRDLARGAIDAGADLAVEGAPRQFFYLPFMHSEALADQDRAIALFDDRLPGDNQRHARLHRDVIARFGRFPWRNADLGRATTPDEAAFLAAGGYGAMVRGAVTLEGSGNIV